MLKSKFKKLFIIMLIGIFISSSLLYFLYETGRILNHNSFLKHNRKEVNLNYMNKAIDGYEGEIDQKEFIERFITWSLLNLYSEDESIENVEFSFSFEQNHVYTQIKIDQNIYEIYDFIEHEN